MTKWLTILVTLPAAAISATLVLAEPLPPAAPEEQAEKQESAPATDPPGESSPTGDPAD